MLKSIKQRFHIRKERYKVTEFMIEKVDLINKKLIDEMQATESMINYLERHDIYFSEPLSFDDASFLIWYHKLKQEYLNVCHN